MEKQGIEQLLRAEDEAARIVQQARENRVKRLRQAQEEAEKTIRDLKEANKAAFARELAQTGQGEQGFAAQLKDRQEAEARNIQAGYEKNKSSVIDMLLRHVCTVELEVGEALKQSLLTKAETGQQ